MKIDYYSTTALLLASQLFDPCSAQKVGVASDTALACWAAAADYNFGCQVSMPLNNTLLSQYGNSTIHVNTTVSASDPTSITRCQCMSVPFLQTFATCLRDRATTFSPVQEGYTFFYRQCFYNAGKIYSIGDLEKMYFNATNYLDTDEYCKTLESRLPANISNFCHQPNRTAYMDRAIAVAAQSQLLLTVPVDIPESAFDTKYRAACASKTQYRLGSVYGIVLMCYWAVAILIASIYRFIQQMYPEILMANNATVNVIRKYLVLPATFRRHRSRPVKLLLNFYICAPTRGQSLLLLGYFILTLIFLGINYETYDSNPLIPGYQNQILKYMGSRTGIIAFTQLPLVIIFGSRNNPLIWSTGWSYDTFQIYHRWTARVMMIMVVIHSACFIAISVIGHTWVFRWEHIINWRFGNLATYSGIIMVLTAVNRFRAKFYEYFFFIHKFFFILFMVGIFRHCWDFGWMPWVYASIALYCSERVYRFSKAFVSGLRNRAYAEVYPDGVIRLSVKYSKRWPVMPGQYCYVRFLRKDMFWQAHPFSVYRCADEHVTTLQFCIAPQKGATRQISNFLKEQPSKSALMPVMIEGPYGVHQDLDKYDTVMLLAGGLGITAIYSYAIHLKQYGLHYSGQKVVFMWVIANTSALEWFSEELLTLMSDDRFEIQIYVTRDLLKDGIHCIDDYAEEDDQDLNWPGGSSPTSNHPIVYEEGTTPYEQNKIYEQQAANGKSLPNRLKTKYKNRMSNMFSNNFSTSTLVNHPDGSPTSGAGAKPHPDDPFYSDATSSRNLTKTDSSIRMIEIPKPPASTDSNPNDTHAAQVQNGAIKTDRLGQPRRTESTDSVDTIASLEHNLSSTMSFGQSHYAQHNLYSNPKLGQSMANVLPAQRFQSQFAHLMSDKRPNVKEEIAKCFQNNTTGLSSAYSHPYNLPGEAEYWEKKMEKRMKKLHNDGGTELGPTQTANSLAPLRSVAMPAKSIGKSLAIISCGPPTLVDNIRASIVDHLEDSEGRVEYFEEAFSW